MTHKFITITPKNKQILPYLNTTVDFLDSFGKVQSLLMKFGCSDLITRQTPSVVPGLNLSCTLYTIGFVHKGYHFLIEFPVLIVSCGRNATKEVRMNPSGRIMLNKVKSLLVDVEIDFLSFEQAMLQFQLISGNDGNPVTIQDFVDEHREQIASDKNVFMLGSGKK